MLVIRRRAGEVLLIADNIEIEVLDVGPTQVKLGIRAPREVTILRKEVQLTRAENVQAAAQSSLDRLNGLARSFSSPILIPSSRSSKLPR